MAVAFGPTCCLSSHVPKSKLLHSPETQYGFVPKLSPHGGKNPALRAKKQNLAVRQPNLHCPLSIVHCQLFHRAQLFFSEAQRNADIF